MTQQLGASPSSSKATDMDEATKQPQTSSESESMKDNEDDVKVCDICGDAGQEDLLAICTRCIDGAEHTYCMRTMLDKLPDDDWLCEDCKFKEEFENQTNYKSELEIGTSGQSCLMEDAQNARSTTHCEVPSTKDGSLVNSEDMVENRRPQCPSIQCPSITVKRQVDNVDLNASTREKASQRSFVSAESLCPQKSSLLSPEDSFLIADSAALKPSNPEQSSECRSTLNGQNGRASLGPIYPTSREDFRVSNGSLLKSSSFNKTCAKPKVKQPLGVVPLAPNATGKIASKDTQKGGLTRDIVKSVSFRTEKWGCIDAKSINEKQSVNLMQIKVGRDKERSVLEREDSSISDSHHVVDARISGGSTDGDTTGYNRANSLRLSRSSSGANSIGLNLQDQKRCQVPKEGFNSHKNAANKSRKPKLLYQPNNHPSLESTDQDGTIKGATCFTIPNKPISGGGRTFCCQKCNEAGHPTQLCSIEKHCVSAMNLSADRTTREFAKRSNKWKEARETIIPKPESLLYTKTTDQSKELPISNSGFSSKAVKNELQPIPSHCNGKMYIHEGRANSETSLNPHAAPQNDFRHVAEAGGLNPSCNISEVFIVKSSKQVFPSLDLCHANTLRTSVIPALEFFWQGDFEILRTGRFPESCDGLQAHLSSYASGKVFEAAKKFPPYKVQLAEVSCPSSWPPHFHGNHAKEHNVALFFFAKDIESYRSNYCKLLENMLKNDLALKGNIGGVELLIFPSNKLPEKSQRWNRLLFLWGIFNRRKSSGLEVLSSSQDNPCKNTIDAKPLVEDMPCTLLEASNYQETNTSWNFDKADKYATHMEVTPASSTEIENKIYIVQDSLVSKSLCRTFVNVKNNSSRDSGHGEELDSISNVGSNNIQVNLSEDRIMPASAAFLNQRQGADSLRLEDAEQENINKENDILGDKSSGFLLNTESERRCSNITFRRSSSNVPLDMPRNSSKSMYASEKTNPLTYNDENEQKKDQT